MAVKSCSVPSCDTPARRADLCGRHHQRKVRTGDPLGFRTVQQSCEVCGAEYRPYTSRQRTCSPECKQVRDAAKSRERAALRRATKPRPKVNLGVVACEACGTKFVANGRRFRYCTAECYESRRHADNWKHLNARRARLRGAYVETVDRVAVFVRDNWICQICHSEIDPDLKFPHRRSATVDHIVPISRGGLHEMANAQSAHLSCNARKGNRMEVAA